MHRLIAKSSNGMLQLEEIGSIDSKPKWYMLLPKCKSFADRAERGELVNITSKSEGDKNIISYIKKATADGLEPSELSSELDSSPLVDTFNKKKYDVPFDPNYQAKKEASFKEEAERKNRQGTLGAVATIVASLGFTKKDSAEDIAEFAYQLYTELNHKLAKVVLPDGIPEQVKKVALPNNDNPAKLSDSSLEVGEGLLEVEETIELLEDLPTELTPEEEIPF